MLFREPSESEFCAVGSENDEEITFSKAESTAMVV